MSNPENPNANSHYLPFYEPIDPTLSDAEKIRAGYELNQGIVDVMAENLHGASNTSHPAGRLFSHLTLKVFEENYPSQQWYWQVDINMNTAQHTGEHGRSIILTRVEPERNGVEEDDKESYEWFVNEDVVQRIAYPAPRGTELAEQLFSMGNGVDASERPEEVTETGVSPTEIRNLLAFIRTGTVVM